MSEELSCRGPRFQVGDRITWRFTTTRGYGYATAVAGVVEKLNSKTVRIRVAEKVWSWEYGQRTFCWKIRRKNVQEAKLSHRITHVPEVDDY